MEVFAAIELSELLHSVNACVCILCSSCRYSVHACVQQLLLSIIMIIVMTWMYSLFDPIFTICTPFFHRCFVAYIICLLPQDLARGLVWISLYPFASGFHMPLQSLLPL